MPNWKKVEAGVSNSYDFEQNSVLEGKYIQKRTGVGPNNSCVYEIQQDNGTVVSMWGSTVIDFRMVNVPFNSMIKIEYKGLVKNPKSKRFYKDFDIFIDDDNVEIPIFEDPDYEAKKEAGLEPTK